MATIIAALRTGMFYLYGIVVAIILTCFGWLFLWPLPIRQRYQLAKWWGWLNVIGVRWICGLTYRVNLSAPLPTKPMVVLSSHSSTYETMFLQMLLPPQTWLIKRELLWIPLFGWSIRMLKPIVIDRSAPIPALKALLRQGKARLNEDKLWVVIFPQGTRSSGTTVGHIHPGGASLAVSAGADVMFVAHDAGRFWPKSGLIRPGVVTVTISAPQPATSVKAVNVAFVHYLTESGVVAPLQ